MTSKKLNLILKIVILSLIILASAGLFLANQYLTGVAKQTERLKSQSEVYQTQIKKYQATEAKVASLGYVDELANKVLPDESSQSSVLAELSQFAVNAGLRVEQIDFQDTASAAAAKKVNRPKNVQFMVVRIEFKSGARYENLLKFLNTVENNRRKMQVTNISLTPTQADGTVMEKVAITINLYSKGKQ